VDLLGDIVTVAQIAKPRPHGWGYNPWREPGDFSSNEMTEAPHQEAILAIPFFSGRLEHQM
jgi:hypothetical protein